MDVLTRKLESFCPFDQQDRDLLASVVAESWEIGPDQDIIQEGETPEDVHLITSGFACRYKLLADGSRQIFAFLVPGDFCDLHVFILNQMDHSIGTLSRCTVVNIPRDRVIRLTEHPAIARALWWVTLVDEGTLREWLVNMGRRQAPERLGHFLCEILTRLNVVGLVTDNAFDFPVTQSELGDTMGLSAVHINRALQTLRSQNLIAFSRGRLTGLDLERLLAFSGFESNYLHLEPYRLKHQRPKLA